MYVYTMYVMYACTRRVNKHFRYHPTQLEKNGIDEECRLPSLSDIQKAVCHLYHIWNLLAQLPGPGRVVYAGVRQTYINTPYLPN